MKCPPTADQRIAVRDIQHTADLGVEITADDLSSLFSAAGQALYGFIADPATIEMHEERSISVGGDGTEDLLHSWLCELLALFNLAGFIGKRCEVTQMTNERVIGIITGEKLDLSRHRFHTEIKGVTYHGLKVWQENGSWRARVIFDV